MTLGRESTPVVAAEAAVVNTVAQDGNYNKIDAYIAALGGKENLTSVDACTTRLRLNVLDNAIIDDTALKQIGARGVLRPSANTVQVIIGPEADTLASEIRSRIQ